MKELLRSEVGELTGVKKTLETELAALNAKYNEQVKNHCIQYPLIISQLKKWII
jgi:hypothetical protein